MTLGRPEEDWIPISALQHYGYCPRQCALIHVAQIFEENLYTLRGQTVHEHVHDGGRELRDSVGLERDLPIWSTEHRLTGKADLVEFEGEAVRPVEYKAGKLKNEQARNADQLQLCAQALCLEEMYGAAVEEGALYYAGSRRRKTVRIDNSLRKETLQVAEQVRRQLDAGDLPTPVNDARCPDCSLKEGCVPGTADVSSDRLARYLQGLGSSGEAP